MEEIKTEYISHHHRFFPEVIALGNKHSSTLGFMPEGGFLDYAQRKCIIVAYSGKEFIGLWVVWVDG